MQPELTENKVATPSPTFAFADCWRIAIINGWKNEVDFASETVPLESAALKRTKLK